MNNSITTHVYLETSPLHSGHAHRGIGMYTRQLQQALGKLSSIKVVDSIAQADVVHYPYFDFFAPSLPLFKPKPTVVTIHDAIPLQFPDHYPVGIKGTAALLHQKLALLSTAAIITDSEASKKMLLKHLGIPTQKINVIPLAADPELSYQSKTDQLKVAKKYALTEKYILYVGDINYNKNIPMLIAALAELPAEYKLVLVGKNFRPQPIPEWQAIESALEKTQVKERVILLQNVESISDLAAIYSQAAVYVQPSLAEGFGLPILEAMQCHCPVVCFEQSSMAEVGGNHVVYAQNVSTASLAKAITDVLTWKEHDRRKWVIQAYSWSQTFSWKKTAAQTAAVYQSILL